MSNTNAYTAFATQTGANVMSAAAWAALAIRLTGFQSGIAPSIQVNTPLRQASVIATMIAQFCADYGPNNILDDGNIATLEANFIAALKTLPASGSLLNIQVFSSAGTHTYTETAGTNSVIVDLCGGGGSGAGAAAATGSNTAIGGSGGGGARGASRFTSGFNGVTVTVGAGGVAPSAGNNNGNAGGTSSFGSLLSASGGGAGFGGAAVPTTNINLSPPSNGGLIVTGANLLSLLGNPSFIGYSPSAASVTAQSGSGGGSPFGGGGAYGVSLNSPGQAGMSPGAGGSGGLVQGSATPQPGGAGANGIVLVYEFA